MSFFVYLLIALGLVVFLNYNWPHFLLKTLAVLLALYGGYKFFYPSYSWRQKITIEVETPSGLKRASSVQAAGYDMQPPLLPEGHRLDRWLKGEAVVLEVRPGKYLFALLKGVKYRGNANGLGWYYFQKRFKGDDHAIGRHLEGDRGTYELVDEYRPLLVTFTDIKDPKSVKKVDPYDLSAHFGPGVKLRRMTLKITDEPVTRGRVEKVFDYFWWSKEKRRVYTCETYGCGRNPLRINYSNGTSDALSKLDFSAGID